MLDVLIKNGEVYDGTGTVPFRADVAVKDGAIKEIIRNYKAPHSWGFMFVGILVYSVFKLNRNHGNFPYDKY